MCLKGYNAYFSVRNQEKMFVKHLQHYWPSINKGYVTILLLLFLSWLLYVNLKLHIWEHFFNN